MEERIIYKAEKRWKILEMVENFPFIFLFLMCYNVRYNMGIGNFGSLITKQRTLVIEFVGHVG